MSWFAWGIVVLGVLVTLVAVCVLVCLFYVWFGYWSKRFRAARYYRRGRYREALELNKQAYGFARGGLGAEHPWTLVSRSNMAVMLEELGYLSQAHRLCEQVLASRRKVLGEEHTDTLQSLSNLAAVLHAMGDPKAARPHAERALELYRKVSGPTDSDTIRSLNNLGTILSDLGETEAATRCHEDCLELQRTILGNEVPQRAENLIGIATSRNNLGCLFQRTGDLAEAISHHEVALTIRKKVLGLSHPDTAMSLHNLSMARKAIGDLAEARRDSDEALEILRAALGEKHPKTATVLVNAAILRAKGGDYLKALRLLLDEVAPTDDWLIAQFCRSGSDRQRLTTLSNLFHHLEIALSLVARRLANSRSSVLDMFDLVLRRKAVAAEALIAQRDAVLSGRYPELRVALEGLRRLAQEINRKTLAGPVPGEGLEAHNATLARWQSDLETQERELARQIPEMDLRRRLESADRNAVALALEEGSALVEFIRFREFGFEDTHGPDETDWKGYRYLAFVLTADNSENVQMIDLGEAEPIDLLIHEFRHAIIHPRGLAPLSSPVPQEDRGTALRRHLVDPLLPSLGTNRRLLLSPDGDLTRLPFEVLPTAAGRRLLDDYQVRYLSSGRDLLRFGAVPPGRPETDLVVADPDFDLDENDPPAAVTPGNRSRDLDSGLCVARLPGTRLEGERIASRLGITPVMGEDVLDVQLQAICSPRILHLATHGFFLPDQTDDRAERLEGAERLSGAWENPLLRAGLLLSGFNTWIRGGHPPTAAEDGMLTAADVVSLDLTDTQLVVLSACETGLGHVHGGEGVFGLRRAFVLAGARTLVMSLWKVDDLATAVLMERFYENLLERRLRCDEALRHAQLHVRRISVGQLRRRWLDAKRIDRLAGGDAVVRLYYERLAACPDSHTPFAEPAFWGAFICQGDPARLRVGPTGNTKPGGPFRDSS